MSTTTTTIVEFRFDGIFSFRRTRLLGTSIRRHTREKYEIYEINSIKYWRAFFRAHIVWWSWSWWWWWWWRRQRNPEDKQTYTNISNLMLNDPAIYRVEECGMHAIMQCNVNQCAYIVRSRHQFRISKSSVFSIERERERDEHNGECDFSHQSRKLMRFLLNLIYCCQWPFPCASANASPFQFNIYICMCGTLYIQVIRTTFQYFGWVDWKTTKKKQSY